MNIDAVIIGGGIAGLWTLAALRARGYSAVLLEKDALGGVQTLASQGIIHGGTKYSLDGKFSAATQAISAMPARWYDALQGRGELDLREVKLLSAHQYLWTANALGSKITGFFASKLMKSHMEKCSRETLPGFLPPDFRGHCYALNEPVVDIPGVLQSIARQYGRWIASDCTWQRDGEHIHVHADGVRHTFTPQRLIFTAGAGNGELTACAQQLRPLHMAALRVPTDAADIFGHHLGMSDKPKITVTTHKHGTHKVYYLGGLPAEEGVKRTQQAQIVAMRAALLEALPWFPRTWLDESAFCTFAIDRAESDNQGARPNEPVLMETGRDIIAWPTKLAFAPLLAQRIAAAMPPPRDNPDVAFARLPRIGVYPWQEAAK